MRRYSSFASLLIFTNKKKITTTERTRKKSFLFPHNQDFNVRLIPTYMYTTYTLLMVIIMYLKYSTAIRNAKAVAAHIKFLWIYEISLERIYCHTRRRRSTNFLIKIIACRSTHTHRCVAEHEILTCAQSPTTIKIDFEFMYVQW